MKEYKVEWFTKAGSLCTGTVLGLNDEDALERAKLMCSVNGWILSRVFK